MPRRTRTLRIRRTLCVTPCLYQEHMFAAVEHLNIVLHGVFSVGTGSHALEDVNNQMMGAAQPTQYTSNALSSES